MEQHGQRKSMEQIKEENLATIAESRGLVLIKSRQVLRDIHFSYQIISVNQFQNAQVMTLDEVEIFLEDTKDDTDFVFSGD